MGLDWGTDPTLSFSSPSQVVTESSGLSSITVRLSETADGEVTVPFTVTGTADGGGMDYTIADSPLVIPVGQLTADIVVALSADGVNEADETVVVTLDAPTNAVLGAPDVHTLTITEGELPPPDPAGTAVLPVYQRMGYVGKTFPSPVDVAIDQSGRIYVVDSYADTVFRLSPGGTPLDGLTGLAAPLCVAVDGTGRIYVGNKGTGNVAVYDTDFNLLFKLGSGDGEFEHPGDIAIDSSGKVYVVDTKKGTVSRWDAGGDFIDLVGGPGDGSGEFNRPLSVALDEIDQKIIVLDRSNGARVQIFDMVTGTVLTSWYNYSTAIGGLIRPQHIAVDVQHRLYVTESAQNVVLVYDMVGAYLGAVYDTDSPVRSPVGLAVSSTNMLYVASRASRKVEVYGLDEYAAMAAAPAALSFTATLGQAAPAGQLLSINNTGTTTFTTAMSADADWIGISGGAVEIGPDQTASVQITADAGELVPGMYSGTLAVSAGPGTAETVQVSLTVLPEPPYIPVARVSVTPERLSFSAEVGSLPLPRVITISNTGDAPLDWEIFPEKDWMSVSRTSGTIAVGGDAQDVVVLAETASLTIGTYSGYLEVYGQKANNAILDISLTLTSPDPGSSPTPPPGTMWKGTYNRIWTVAAQTNGTALNSLWGTGSDIFAVGDSGTILHYDGLDWTEELLPTTLNLNGVWGTSVSSVYAVGENGLLLHYDGENWTDVSLAFADALQNVWCSDNSNCAAVGQNSTILDNVATDAPWIEEHSLEGSGSLRGIWGFSDSELYVVGDFGMMLQYTGGLWTTVDAGTEKNLFAVWGSAVDDVYAVGQNGIIVHYNGISWSPMESGTTATLRGVWGNGADEVYAVGEDGTLLLFTGSQWRSLDIGITEDFNDAWAAVEDEIYVVGSDGSILFGRRSFAWGLFFPAILAQDPQAHSGTRENR